MIEKATIEITRIQAKERLDKVLSESLTDISRSRLKALITEGQVMRADICITSPKHKVQEGEIYTVFVPPPTDPVPVAQNIPLDIIYEDEHLIVVNKPAGMVVHPAAGAPDGTLVNALLYHCGDSLSGIGGVKRPGIVHRIDKDTSGLLVVAKNDKAHAGLAVQFEDHSIERLYTAVVRGIPSPADGRIESYIARHPKDRKKMAVSTTHGKWAATNYRSIQHFTSNGYIIASLIECKLETGRTHQIRVHMASINCALVGDPVYGGQGKISGKIRTDTRTAIQAFKRQALHARVLGFIHPISKKALYFETQLPNDMSVMIDRLS